MRPAARSVLLAASLVGSLFVPSPDAAAQGLPVTQVWLAEIKSGVPENPALISAASGYNNQPMFSADGKEIFFTAEQEDGQTDIARFNINSGELRPVNRSPESEYSPTPVPGRDAVSVIRVELPDQIQRLWVLSLSQDKAELLMPSVEPVGYHCWIDRQSVAVFILGESFTLHKATVGGQPSVLLADHVGRTIRKHPGNGEILFVSKLNEPWSISTVNMVTGIQTKVISLFPESEDFEVDPSGHYWMGYGSKLYRSSDANDRWQLAADLRESGIDNITRLAISPDGKSIAIVSSP